MSKTDDPVFTPILLTAAGIGGSLAASKMAGEARRTTTPQQTTFEVDKDMLDPQKKVKKAQKAALQVVTKDWELPTLGTPGLLGFGG